MTRIVMKSKVGGDGVLHLPLGQDEANKDVLVTVEHSPFALMPHEQWRDFILSTAGKWQGDFERPNQGEYEEREPLP